jgi:hypothetical protein
MTAGASRVRRDNEPEQQSGPAAGVVIRACTIIDIIVE